MELKKQTTITFTEEESQKIIEALDVIMNLQNTLVNEYSEFRIQFAEDGYINEVSLATCKRTLQALGKYNQFRVIFPDEEEE